MDLPNAFNAGTDAALDFDPNAFSFDAQVPAGGTPGGEEPSIDELLALYQTAQDQPDDGGLAFAPGLESGGDPLGGFGAFNFGDPATDEPFSGLEGLGALDVTVPAAPASAEPAAAFDLGAPDAGGFDFGLADGGDAFGAPAAGAEAFDFGAPGAFDAPASDDPLGAPSGFAGATLGAAPPFGLEPEAAPDFGELDFSLDASAPAQELSEFVPDEEMAVFPAFEAEASEPPAFEPPAFELPELAAEPAPEAASGFELPDAEAGFDFALPDSPVSGFELGAASGDELGFELPSFDAGPAAEAASFELPASAPEPASAAAPAEPVFELGGATDAFELGDFSFGESASAVDEAPAFEMEASELPAFEPAAFELPSPEPEPVVSAPEPEVGFELPDAGFDFDLAPAAAEAAPAPAAPEPFALPDLGDVTAAFAPEPALPVEAALLPPEPAPAAPMARREPDPDQTLRLRDVGAPLVPQAPPALSVDLSALAVVPVGTSEERQAARAQLTQVLSALEGGVETVQTQMATLYAELQRAAVRRAPVDEIQALAVKLAEAKAAVGTQSPLHQQATFLRQMADAYLTLLETL